jgi:pimeloyl-ACP methyl ester carboxylesterase
LLDVPGDSALAVFHAPASVELAVIYLHGVCGRLLAISDFAEELSQEATLIALRGDERCEGSSRHRWTMDVLKNLGRIRRALDVVKEARAGHLDTDRVVLFGYSQGASRAQLLAQRAPELFPHVILGGPPRAPDPARLAEVRLDRLAEGLCLQTLHIGPYAAEAPVLADLHGQVMPRLGLTFAGPHHEIYLSDPRRTAPEALKTLLRQPVRPA